MKEAEHRGEQQHRHGDHLDDERLLGKGGEQDSLKPKSPLVTESTKPPSVASAKPTPSSAAQTRRTTTTPTPITKPAIDWNKNSGPMVAMER
ncbi:MAG TPA: hypothetical protein VMF35_12490 [Acidimicrobiales bacterium]|nr:hypothetical protein [Acidimicrobiales bacterium]